jgi:hypothetical protein
VAAWCTENKLQEFQMWGIGDVESMLLQPKNEGADRGTVADQIYRNLR